MSDPFNENLEFEWDTGNIDKNWIKHKVDYKEAEQAFFDKLALRSTDELHSQAETRWFLLGKTHNQKLLAIFFTKRGDKIRIISARPASRKEKQKYESQKI